MDERLPLTIVTGFLGSGKTTLIRRFIETADGEHTGIVVNEFGETGVDHRLFVHAAEQVELLDGGCLCCARRSDIAKSLYDVVKLAGEGGAVRRAILETSGLADPAPLIATLARDPWLKQNVQLASVVAVVDAVAGLRNLETRPEARRQVATADTVVVSKGDMRSAQTFANIRSRVLHLSPDARVLDAQDETYSSRDVLAARSILAPQPSAFTAEGAQHSAEVGSFVLRLKETIDWPTFTLWLTALLHAHGDRILRVKGLLKTSSSSTKLAIHGVQHVMHPPTHMPYDEAADPDESFLVFITDGLERARLERSLTKMQDVLAGMPVYKDAPAI
jgi:G3E family GTPase